MVKNGGILGALIAVAGVAGYAVFRCFCPQYYPSWYWIVPAFYLLVALLFTGMFSGAGKEKLFWQKCLILKMVKLLGALLIIILYAFLVKTNSVAFVIVNVLFFIVFTLFETRSLVLLNKKNTKNGK